MKFITSLLAAIALITAINAPAQTNGPAASSNVVDQAASGFASWLTVNTDFLSSSNWNLSPYVTYAPTAPTKFGGGLFLSYELMQNVGTGIGLDWLGQFWMPSGNVTLKQSFHPFGTNFTVTPFAIAGIATPLGGAGADNGSLATIYGGGLSVSVLTGHSVDVNAGYAGVYWQNAGDYSSLHHELFFTFKLHRQ